MPADPFTTGRATMLRWTTNFLLSVLLAMAAAAQAQGDAAAGPLAPLAHWVGGQWASTVKTSKGEEVRIIRSYRIAP